jgi:hypothetical protein
VHLQQPFETGHRVGRIMVGQFELYAFVILTEEGPPQRDGQLFGSLAEEVRRQDPQLRASPR